MMEILAKLPTASELKAEIKLSERAMDKKKASDKEIAAVLAGICDKFLLVVGPCSADDPAAVLEYAAGLAKIAERVQDRIIVIARIFTAKPRTGFAGYMGLIHEPGGIVAARRLHVDVLEKTGLVTADELLYPALYPYFEDVVSYFTIGARSVENQEHRLVASGISAPVGVKNPLSGWLDILLNSIASARAPHDFVFCGKEVRTCGNPMAHAVLRGAIDGNGANIPNYHAEVLMKLHGMYQKANLTNPAVIIDTNHANSGKDYARQPNIAMDVMKMRGESPIIQNLVKGLMIESYIQGGNQSFGGGTHGLSVTDPCLSLVETERMIMQIADKLQ